MRTYLLDVTNCNGYRVQVNVRARSLERAIRFAESMGCTDCSVHEWTPATGRPSDAAFIQN